MTPTFVADDRLVRLRNDDGEWRIWKRWESAAPAGLGPGYVFAFRTPPGRYFVLDSKDADGTVNDPRYGGLGCFGMHVARRNGQADPANYSWDVTGRHRAATRSGFGAGDLRILDGPGVSRRSKRRAICLDVEVDLFDGEAFSAGLPLVTVRYEYVLFSNRLNVTVTMTTGPGAHVGSPAFVKEPKLVCHGLAPSIHPGAHFREAEVFDARSQRLLRRSLADLPDPTKSTIQIGASRRARLRWHDRRSGSYFNIVARAVRDDGERVAWEGMGAGLDLWARRSNDRERLEPCEPDEDYCLQGPPDGTTLTRQWEVAKWEDRPETGVMLHGWEGGSGYPDCRCCYRRFGPAGETYRNFLSFALNRGWAV